jgi:hypothetical protein
MARRRQARKEKGRPVAGRPMNCAAKFRNLRGDAEERVDQRMI